MFSRAFFSLTPFFTFKYFRSVDVVTLNRFSDVVPALHHPLTVHLSRCGPPPLPGAPPLTVHLSRCGPPPLPGAPPLTVHLSRCGPPPLPGAPPLTVHLSRCGPPPLPGAPPLTVHLSRCGPPPLPGAPPLTRSFSTNRKMPKKEKTVKGRPAGAAAEAGGSCPVSADKSGAVIIAVHAKPGSKHSAITDVGSEAVGVSIAAPPTDGEANVELVRYLAEVLELKKSHVSLDKGSRSRDKLIRLDSSLSPEEVLRRLREAAG